MEAMPTFVRKKCWRLLFEKVQAFLFEKVLPTFVRYKVLAIFVRKSAGDFCSKNF
jgi:hypothetical protein